MQHNSNITMSHLCSLFIGTIAVAAGGCIHLEQKISIKSENHATFHVYYSVPNELAKTFADSANPAHLRYRELFDISQGRKWYEADSGIAITRYRVFDQGDRRHVRVEGRTDDLSRAFASGKLGSWRLESLDNVSRLTADTGVSVKGEKSPRQTEHLWDDLYLNLIIEVPGEILKSTAPKRKKKRVQWTFDTDKNADFLTQPPEILVEYKH